MFPVQTNKTPNLLRDIVLPNIESAREIYFGTPLRRAACARASGRRRAGLAQQAHSRGHPIRRGERFGGHIPDDIPRGRNEPRPAFHRGEQAGRRRRHRHGRSRARRAGRLYPAARADGRLCRDASHVQESRFRPADRARSDLLLADAPLLAVIGTNVPARSLKELAEYVSANPGKFNYGSPGSGSPAHLTGAAFSQQTGNSMVYVPYKGTPPMVQALLAGDIQVAFPTLTGIIGPVKAGKLRVLAVMARARMAELPDVPTTLEAGFPQLVGGNWWVLAAPRGTNSRIIERLAAEFRNALAEPGVRKRVSDFGHVAIGLAPAETAGFLKSESARYKSIVELGGIKPE